jgi:CRP/FNR family cyclic AMP-dependent transcriptional regulator
VQSRRRIRWERLLGGTRERTRIPAGDLIFRDEEPPWIPLIRAGVVRVFIRTETGRQVTIRYARSGDLIGLASLLGVARRWNAEAVVASTLEVLTLEQVRAAAARNPELLWVIAEYVATCASDIAVTLADRSSQPMVARVARHLRELALSTPDGRAVVHISHQRLADAVGTAREVISRQLAALRADGVIDTRPGRIILVDEKRLEDLAAGDSVRLTGKRWPEGSDAPAGPRSAMPSGIKLDGFGERGGGLARGQRRVREAPEPR